MISGLVRHNGSGTTELREGDAVEVQLQLEEEGEVEEAYAVLRGPFVEASWGAVVDFFIFPAWYEFERVITTNAKKTHRFALGGSVALEPPISASEIVNRVQVVHSWKRICSTHEAPANCRCADNCYVRAEGVQAAQTRKLCCARVRWQAAFVSGLAQPTPKPL